MSGIIEISSTSLLLTSLLSILFGVIILVAPKTLNYVVAVYFVIIGVAGLFTLYG